MKAIITKGSLFQEVEKKVYRYLCEILLKKARETEKEKVKDTNE